MVGFDEEEDDDDARFLTVFLVDGRDEVGGELRFAWMTPGSLVSNGAAYAIDIFIENEFFWLVEKEKWDLIN